MTKLVLLLTVLAFAAAGCGGSDSLSPGAATTTPAEEALPGPVAEKHEAIVDAAHALDYDQSETLLDSTTFTYSFGEGGDPIGYWRRLEEQGETPILGDCLPTVLAMPWARKGPLYVWPSAHAKKPSEWAQDDRKPLERLFTEEEIPPVRAGRELPGLASRHPQGRNLALLRRRRLSLVRPSRRA